MDMVSKIVREGQVHQSDSEGQNYSPLRLLSRAALLRGPWMTGIAKGASAVD